MPASLWFGFFKANTITNGASVSLGVNITQNRNSTKQNNGNLAISGGWLSIPTNQIANFDSDIMDQWNYDHTNVAGAQI